MCFFLIFFFLDFRSYQLFFLLSAYLFRIYRIYFLLVHLIFSSWLPNLSTLILSFFLSIFLFVYFFLYFLRNFITILLTLLSFFLPIFLFLFSSYIFFVTSYLVDSSFFPSFFLSAWCLHVAWSVIFFHPVFLMTSFTPY